VTEIRGWQDVEQVLPLVEKCIKAGREKTTWNLSTFHWTSKHARSNQLIIV
jgi:hypothetical protein